jgi:hypothetical protein
MQVAAENYARMYPSMNISKMVPCSKKMKIRGNKWKNKTDLKIGK